MPCLSARPPRDNTSYLVHSQKDSYNRTGRFTTSRWSLTVCRSYISPIEACPSFYDLIMPFHPPSTYFSAAPASAATYPPPSAPQFPPNAFPNPAAFLAPSLHHLPRRPTQKLRHHHHRSLSLPLPPSAPRHPPSLAMPSQP